MTGVGMTGRGTDGDTFDANKLNFPAIPYGSSDFNGHDRCPTGSMNIENYNDVNQVRNCRLVGLSDLALGKNYVREKVEEYLNHLVDIGKSFHCISNTLQHSQCIVHVTNYMLQRQRTQSGSLNLKLEHAS